MKYLTIIFSLIFGFYYSQTHRFFYELKYKSDSTSSEYKNKIMVLDVNPKETKYYDDSFLEKDSINKVTNSENTNWTDQIPVIRKKNSIQNTNFAMIDFVTYSYPTNDNVKWKLESETKKYFNYELQKATTNFGGRNWNAWFTKEIPFAEGPYKFQGLPGLIVLLQDDKANYVFSLIKSKNLKETYDTSNFLEIRYGDKPLPVSEKIYVSKKIEYYNDPYHRIREGLRDGTTKSFDYNGVRYKNANDLIPMIKSEQDYILKHNNPIELDKAIKYSSK